MCTTHKFRLRAEVKDKQTMLLVFYLFCICATRQTYQNPITLWNDRMQQKSKQVPQQVILQTTNYLQPTSNLITMVKLLSSTPPLPSRRKRCWLISVNHIVLILIFLQLKKKCIYNKHFSNLQISVHLSMLTENVSWLRSLHSRSTSRLICPMFMEQIHVREPPCSTKIIHV